MNGAPSNNMPMSKIVLDFGRQLLKNETVEQHEIPKSGSQ